MVNNKVLKIAAEHRKRDPGIKRSRRIILVHGVKEDDEWILDESGLQRHELNNCS